MLLYLKDFPCVTLVWLFSTMCFQMSPQITCQRGCIVTLVAFVFSTVRSQVCPEIACLRRDKVTLVAFVWRFILAHFCHYSNSFHSYIVFIQIIFKIMIHHWYRKKASERKGKKRQHDLNPSAVLWLLLLWYSN